MMMVKVTPPSLPRICPTGSEREMNPGLCLFPLRTENVTFQIKTLQPPDIINIHHSSDVYQGSSSYAGTEVLVSLRF